MLEIRDKVSHHQGIRVTYQLKLILIQLQSVNQRVLIMSDHSFCGRVEVKPLRNWVAEEGDLRKSTERKQCESKYI